MAPQMRDEYSRFQVETFDNRELINVPLGFLAGFFNPSSSMIHFSDNSSLATIDIIKGKKTSFAKMVHRGTVSENASRGKVGVGDEWSNIARMWPLIEKEDAINNVELLKRQPGESQQELWERQKRLTEKARSLHIVSMRETIHTIELLARQSVLTGKHDMILASTNSNFEYDFYRNPDNFISPTNSWNSGSQTIGEDLDTAVDRLHQNAYYFGECGALMGSDAFTAFKEDATIKSGADILRYNFVTLGGDTIVPAQFKKFQDAGFQPRGWFITPKGRKLWVFTYDVTFEDDFTDPENPTTENWMPVDQVLIFSPVARTDRHFGPPDRLPITPQKAEWYRQRFGLDMNTVMPPNIKNAGVIDPRMFHFHAYEPDNEKSLTLVTQSAPILATTQTDAYVLLKELITA